MSIIDVSVAACDGYSAVGLLATDGCLQSEVYQQALEKKGKSAVLPNSGEVDVLMQLIGRIKAGDKDRDVASSMSELAAALVSRGAEAIIAGCTEIPLELDESMLDVVLISSTDVLAARTVTLARGETPLHE